MSPAASQRAAKSAFSDKKSVARMNPRRPAVRGSLQDSAHVEITLRRRRRPDQEGFIGQMAMRGVRIGFGVNGYCGFT